jgi:hypothetical protein
VVIKLPGIVQVSLGSCSGGSTIKGSEPRKNGVSPSVIGVPAIANQFLRDVSLSDVAISAKTKWDKNKDVSSVLSHAR